MIPTRTISPKHIPSPQNEQDFEIAIVGVANAFFKSTTFQQYGRRGSTQHGIDIQGYMNDDTSALCVIQVKCREPEKQEKPADIKSHVEEALGKFVFKRFIYATTAKRATKVQDAVSALQKELNSKMGSSAPIIQLWDWDTLTEMAYNNPEVLRALDAPSAVLFGILDHIQLTDPDKFRELERVGIEALSPARRQDTYIEIKTANYTGKITKLSKDIDRISQLSAIKPSVALTEFHVLLKKKEHLETIDLARINGGIGNCYFALNDRDRGLDYFQTAYEHAPDRPQSIANYAFVLGFRGKLDDLKLLIKKALELEPKNSSLVARSIYFLGSEAIIPECVAKDPLVWLAKLELKRKSNIKHKILLREARKAVTTHPDDFLLRQFLADTLLGFVLSETAAIAAFALTERAHEYLSEALSTYECLWKELKESDDYQRKTEPALAVNYMQACRIVSDFPEAIKIGKVALDLTNYDEGVVLQYGINLMYNGQVDILKDLVDKLPDCLDADKIRLQIALEQNEWETVERLCDQREVEDRDAGLIRGIKSLSIIERLSEDKRPEAVYNLIETPSEECREWAIRIQLARKYIGKDAALTCLEIAKGLINKGSEMEDILSVAQQAYSLDDVDAVFDLLINNIDYSRPSEALENLLVVASSDYPVRERSLKVFGNLDPSLLSIPRYKEAFAVGAYNQKDFELAAEHFKDLLDISPRLRHWLDLYKCKRRLLGSDAAAKLLDEYPVLELPCFPKDLIELAHIFTWHDKSGLAVKAALTAVSSPRGQASAVVTGSYVGFVFSNASLPPPSHKVATGEYIKIRHSTSGEVVHGIVGSEDHQPWGVALDERDKRINAALDKAVGETFFIQSQFSDKSEWIIEEVLPEFIRAAQYLSKEHTDKFGDAAIVHRIITDGENIEPILEMVRQRGKFVDDTCRKVIENNLPLSLIGGRDDIGGLGLANAIRQRGYNIATNPGTKEVQEEAQLTLANLPNGVVIDLFTAITAVDLDILQILTKTLGTLRMSMEEYEALQSHLEKAQSSENDAMTLSAVDGQILRSEFTPDDRRKRISSLKDVVSQLENSLTIEPVVFGESFSEIEKLILESTPITLAPIELAKKYDAPLLSDDGAMRSLSAQLGHRKGVWLSAVLAKAKTKDFISDHQYMTASLGLVQRKHDVTPLTGVILAEAVEHFSQEVLGNEAKLLIQQIGGPNADFDSHAVVATSMFKSLREKGINDNIRTEAMETVASTIFSGIGAHVALRWASAFGRYLREEDRDPFAKVTQQHMSDIDFNFRKFDKSPLLNSSSIQALITALSRPCPRDDPS